MWQDIITGMIVLFAVAFAVTGIVKSFSDPLRKCEKCTKTCSGCSLQELKKSQAEQEKKQSL